MRQCCEPGGRMAPLTIPFLIQRVIVARSTFNSRATSEALKYNFICPKYTCCHHLSRTKMLQLLHVLTIA